MRILTNPGSNLSEGHLRHYGIDLAAQQIVVDGVSHDTRRGDIALTDVDRWVASAKVHPYVVGTTAAQFASLFAKAGTVREREAVAVMTSRKIIGSYDAAMSAAKTITSASVDAPRIGVADCGMTDLGAGLATLLAAEAARVGLSVDRIVALVERYARVAHLRLIPATLDYFVKGGRATPLRAWIANVLSVRPVIGFVDGEIRPVARVSSREEPAKALLDLAATDHRAKSAVWIAVIHGGVEPAALFLEQELRARFDVRFSCVRPLHASTYLHAGPRALGYVIVPLEALGWDPPAPHAA